MGNETSARLELVTKTTAEWADITDVIIKGVPCVETTTDGKTLMKIGDGERLFAQLPYLTNGMTVTIDSTLSDDSENPVQNKAVSAALKQCLKSTDTLVLKCVL